MTVKLLTESNQIKRERWNHLLSVCSYASPFQSPEYYDLVCNRKDSDAKVFGLEDSEQLKILMVVSLMREPGLARFFSSRGIIFGGPLINGATAEELSYFLSESGNRLKGLSIYLETRNFFDYSFFKNSFLKSDWIYEPYLNIQHNLKGIGKEELLSSFKYNRRREIKQSILNGATYHLSEKKEEIFIVYQILKELYHENVKLPLPSFDFFNEFFKTDNLKVFVVMHNKKIIGGSFCPVLPGRGLYTYYYCGLRNYNKQIFPTHLAVLAALEYAIDNNIPIVDFMGAGKPGVAYGVRNYKLEFGGELVEHGRYIKVLNPFLYKLGKIGLKGLKVMR
jgi:serine/alanine adding enzyme